MNTIDLLFLIVGIAALAAMLVFSPVIRAVVWETLRHPFTDSLIERDGDKITIHHPRKDRPAGAR